VVVVKSSEDQLVVGGVFHVVGGVVVKSVKELVVGGVVVVVVKVKSVGGEPFEVG
jgi:hypothetical protein